MNTSNACEFVYTHLNFVLLCYNTHIRYVYLELFAILKLTYIILSLQFLLEWLDMLTLVCYRKQKPTLVLQINFSIPDK